MRERTIAALPDGHLLAALRRVPLRLPTTVRTESTSPCSAITCSFISLSQGGDLIVVRGSVIRSVSCRRCAQT